MNEALSRGETVLQATGLHKRFQEGPLDVTVLRGARG
jgi:hypothetical protein